MRLAKKLGWVCPENIRAGIKMSAESALSFGKFFAHLLDAARSSWRLELAIFPRSFIDLVLEDCEASRALLELSIAQMAIAHARAEATLEMVAQHQRTDQADLLAVRQIAHGYRPGFVPVYGTERDEQILPAADLHKQLYDNSCRLFEIQMENKKGSRPRGADFYPAIFRPSLADERSFYFFKRSFGPHADVPAPQRAENVLSDVRSHVPLEMRFYEKAFDAELQQMLRQDHCPADASPGLDVRLGLSQFIQAGAIRVTPINFGGATRG